LNATLWADVDDDDDYYATTAPPQNVWTASDSHHTEDKPEIFEVSSFIYFCIYLLLFFYSIIQFLFIRTLMFFSLLCITPFMCLCNDCVMLVFGFNCFMLGTRNHGGIQMCG
jgi:hypothetical protein